MSTVGHRNDKCGLSKPIERDARAEEIAVASRCEPPSYSVPAHLPDALVQTRGLAARIRKSRVGHALGGGDMLRDMIEEGRR